MTLRQNILSGNLLQLWCNRAILFEPASDYQKHSHRNYFSRAIAVKVHGKRRGIRYDIRRVSLRLKHFPQKLENDWEYIAMAACRLSEHSLRGCVNRARNDKDHYRLKKPSPESIWECIDNRDAP